MKSMKPLAETVPMRALAAGASSKEQQLIALLEMLVRIESPSDDKSAVDACADFAVAHATSLGARVKRHKQKHHGDLLELRFGPRKRSAEDRILLLGHLDTVWPLGTLDNMPFRIDKRARRIYGPGVFDMKAGVAMAFTAIEMLLEASLLDREIIFLLNSEEEIGSPVSRTLTEKLAQETSAVYVLEPAQGLAYKTARKGVGDFHLTVYGVAAHSGVDFTSGHLAILELSKLIQKVSAWTNLKSGLTINPGVISGGTRSNVVAAQATAHIDVRISRAADGPRIEKRFAALTPSDKACTLVIEGGINRPPMERKRGTVQLFRRAQKFASELDIPLTEASTGGASDGNFTAALGIPTLDGMGAIGEGAHAPHESIQIDHLIPRTTLLAAMLTR